MNKKSIEYLKLLRVKHYIKNLLVLIPTVFNHSLFKTETVVPALLGFIVFCFISSAVYIFNDIYDINEDRKHSKKRLRPLASGKVSVVNAKVIALILIILAFLLHSTISKPLYFVCPILYIMLNVLYSIWLKKQPIIDVVVLSSGFLIRVVYGAVISNIMISGWLYLTVITGSFYLGLGKRRNELQRQEDSCTRTVLKYYTYSFLDKNMHVFLALSLAFYSLWAVGTDSKYMIWTVPMVMVIFMRYSLDIESDYDGDPVEVVTHDKFLFVFIIGYIIMVLGALYLV